MRMKKKLVSLALAAVMLTMLLTGCSGNGSSGTVPEETWTTGQTSIKLLGGSWYSENGQVYVFYSVEATNRSSRTFGGSSIDVTCLDEENHGLNYSSSYIVPIAAGDTIQYSTSLKYTGRTPTSIELYFADKPYMYSDDKVSYQSEFVVKDVSSSSSSAFYTISGTVVNNSSIKQGVRVSAVFMQDGKIIGGDFGYSDPIEAGESGTFTIYLPHIFEGCDLYEVVANAYNSK
jgi:hypothetical protein